MVRVCSGTAETDSFSNKQIVDMKKILWSLLGLLGMSSCEEARIKYTGTPLFAETQTLSPETVNDDFIFDFPRQIALWDTLLIVRDAGALAPGAASYFHVFSNKGNYLGSVGRRGRGPGELLESATLTVDRQGWAYAYDPMSQKIVGYNLRTLRESPACEFKEFDMRNVLPRSHGKEEYTRITDVLSLPEGRFLVIGNNGRLRFGSFAGSDTVETLSNTYPRLTEDGTWEEVWSIFNSSCKTRISPTGAKLASATYVGAVLDCFDTDGIQIKNGGTYRIYEPVYKIFEGVVPTQITRTDHTVIGFEDIYVTDRYIYTLLNGSSQQDYNYPDAVAVFDWQGNPVRSYRVGRKLCRLAVDEERGVIYAFTAEEGEAGELIRFDLPKNR